ncbi:FxSxx-COOH system tetratricopeptide repeat protein [Frankia sp. R82]|uniref:FxSxx-COOH system tetratricopeptide repeat protein n=1 Tax=Frankia sp. R82 TaxID=2950553 RepID=UPI0020432EA6|nr:FxSxx-COOH system tetratricopeptide repeat protein [Frankia sp. R82]MCM3887447.1 FxSxx-COOH system tetratricopeptide repeat protein [Frankia sp. R82]
MGTGAPAATGTPSGAVDFFVSYISADQTWAQWVAWQLEAAGYTTLIQAWDFSAGAHVVTEMHWGTQRAVRTVAVLSAAYLSSAYAEAEWQAAWADDPTGQDRKLLVFRIEDCPLPGLLAQLVSVDLFGLDRDSALARLVAAARGERGKPQVEPLFPGGPSRPVVTASGVEPEFPGRLPAIWNVPGRNRLFTGRQAQLDEVRARLGVGPVAVTALHGMGGVGKTQLVLEHAHRQAAAYSLVWWVEAEQTALLAEKIAALARPLGLPADGPVVEVAGAVLAALGRREGWLVVFDNAEDPAALRRWLPAGPGHVLITSRHPGWDMVAATIEVDLLPRAESIALLTRRLPDLNPAVADALAGELGDLPLALAQAAGYLTRTRLEPAVYLTRFRTRRQVFLGKGDDLLYAGRVDTCWAIALDRLHHDNPATVQLLEVCALLAPEPIPIGLLTTHPDLLGPPLGAIAADTHPDLDLDEVIGAALDYSLARRSGDSLVVHRLVQTVIAGQLTPTRHTHLTTTTARLLAAATPNSPRDPATWPGWAALGPHLLHALTSLEGTEDPHGLRRAANRFCWHLYARGDRTAAHTLATRLHQQNTRLLSPDHHDTLDTAITLAAIHAALGEHQAARALDEDTHTRQQRIFGDDHPRTLTSANNLANRLAALGDLQAARALNEDTHTRQQRILGNDHPDTLHSAHNLAVRLAEVGELPAACALEETVLKRRRRILGVDHPDTLDTAHNLAVDLAAAGRVGQARVLLVDTLARCRQVLGQEHPSTQMTARILAGLPADPPPGG